MNSDQPGGEHVVLVLFDEGRAAHGSGILDPERQADRQDQDPELQRLIAVLAEYDYGKSAGTLHLDGVPHELEADAGVFVASGETIEIENPGPDPIVVVSVLAPADRALGAGRKVVVRFADQPELRADAKRTFRYLVDEEAGCADVTQFIGIVEPCRAPDHSHSYDEVGYIIEGEGVAHIGAEHIPLRPGSCFHLPPELVHCIENNGSGVMRIMGVFHPSGDPASRSYDEARS